MRPKAYIVMTNENSENTYYHFYDGCDALGNVCPCDLTPLKLGNVLEQPLTEIWSEMSEWFNLPRSGCLMKCLCTETDAFGDISELPLCKEKSRKTETGI